MELTCATCNYKTTLKTNLDRHNKTKRHMKLCGECVSEATSETGEQEGLIPMKYLPIVELMELNHKQEIELLKANHQLELLKVTHEMELKIKDTVIQCGNEKMELMERFLSKTQPVYHPVPSVLPTPMPQPTPQPKPSQPTPQPNSEIEPEPQPEPQPEPKPQHQVIETIESVSPPPSPKPSKCMKLYLETKCTAYNSDDFISEVIDNIEYNEIMKILEIDQTKHLGYNNHQPHGVHGKLIHDYLLGLITKVYKKCKQYNKPFYYYDTYHGQAYYSSNGTWIRDNIDTIGKTIINQIETALLEWGTFNDLLYKYTEEEHEENPNSKYRIGDYMDGYYTRKFRFNQNYLQCENQFICEFATLIKIKDLE